MKLDLVVTLRESLAANEQFFSRPFTATEIEYFCRYYQLVLKWNERLHLTTITAPQEFAERHLLESAFASQKILLTVHRVWDVGSGAGIPGIPFAILRPHLRIILIEANRNKAIFLKEAVSELGISNVEILSQRFETISGVEAGDCVTTRALDSLNRLTPEIFKFGQAAAQFLLFGNQNLSEVARMYMLAAWKESFFPIPNSENRLLISHSRFT